MKIATIIPESTIDYPGKIGPIIFVNNCNYRCPTCHNSQLVGKEISEESFEKAMKNIERKAKTGWYTGATICGGEPTSYLGLNQLARRLKEMGLSVKLDTNGKNFGTLQTLLEDKLIDYVAMDVKAPPSLYSKVTGMHVDMRDDVEKGMAIATRFPDYEFRTTMVPIWDNDKIRWMSPEEVVEMAKFIVDNTGSNEHKYFLQGFEARSEKDMMNKTFGKENLPKEFQKTPDDVKKQMLEIVKSYLPRAKIR